MSGGLVNKLATHDIMFSDRFDIGHLTCKSLPVVQIRNKVKCVKSNTFKMCLFFNDLSPAINSVKLSVDNFRFHRVKMWSKEALSFNTEQCDLIKDQRFD